MPEPTGGQHSKSIMIRHLHHQNATGERIETGRKSEGRGDAVDPTVASHAVAGEPIHLPPPDHDRPSGSNAFEPEPVGGLLTGLAEPSRGLDRGAYVDRRPGLRSAGVMMWSPPRKPSRIRCRRQGRRGFEQFLRSPARFLQPRIGLISGRGDEQIRRSIAKCIRAGRLQHEDEPGEPGRIHPPSPVEDRPPDSKAICGLHRGPANRSDLTVQAGVVEAIDRSNACFSCAFLDSERQW